MKTKKERLFDDKLLECAQNNWARGEKQGQIKAYKKYLDKINLALQTIRTIDDDLIITTAIQLVLEKLKEEIEKEIEKLEN